MRANPGTYIWRNSRSVNTQYPSITSSGWHATGEIYWLDKAFPDNVDFFLCDNDEAGYEFGSEVDTDNGFLVTLLQLFMPQIFLIYQYFQYCQGTRHFCDCTCNSSIIKEILIFLIIIL